MKYRTILTLMALFFSVALMAQSGDKKEPGLSKKDSLRLAKFNARGTYPVIKASKFSGVLPVKGINEFADSSLKYKLVINLTAGTSDPERIKEANRGLAEIGRIINLHIAAGIPKQNLDVVIVTQGKALYSLFSNEAFKKQFKADNPNVDIIREMESVGVRFVACGQAMQFLEIRNEALLPEVKIALAAKVALSTYKLKGYALYEIDDEE